MGRIISWRLALRSSMRSAREGTEACRGTGDRFMAPENCLKSAACQPDRAANAGQKAQTKKAQHRSGRSAATEAKPVERAGVRLPDQALDAGRQVRFQRHFLE